MGPLHLNFEVCSMNSYAECSAKLHLQNGFVQLQNSISQPNLKDPNCFCFTLFHLRSEQILVPRNACRAVLELYVSFHGNDESSYSSPLSSYLRMNNISLQGNGASREVFLTIDGASVGS